MFTDIFDNSGGGSSSYFGVSGGGAGSSGRTAKPSCGSTGTFTVALVVGLRNAGSSMVARVCRGLPLRSTSTTTC